MKKLLLIFTIISLLSCKKEVEVVTNIPTEKTETANLGKEIFEGKGMCTTCHKADAKIVGPSIKEIATIYIAKKASIYLFLQGEGDAIVDPSQYEIMKANLEITKVMTPDELKSLEDYILSFK